MSRYYRTLLSLGSAPPPPPPVGLVTDLVAGFIHGYSQARKLRGAYTGNILRVRRSSDDTTLDIGETSNELDESALTTFVGANNGFLRRLYDQVGSRILAQESTTANQPQIVDSGTVVKVSGKPYAQYDGTNDFMVTTSATPITDKDCTVFVVFESQSSENLGGVFIEQRPSGGVNNRLNISSDTRAIIFLHSNYAVDGTGRPINFASQQPTSTKRCLMITKTGNDVLAYDETGLQIGSTVTSAGTFSVDTVLVLGRQILGPVHFGGKIAELLINNTALSTTDRNTVLDNIKDFYSIT